MATLMYFAQLAETLGCTSEQVALPASVDKVNALIEWLGRRDGTGWKSLAGGKNVAVMVNKAPATLETAINNNDVIAFIPERLK